MRFNLLWLIFMLFSVQGEAQKKLSLSNAIQMSLRNNFRIQLAERDQDIARNNNTFKNTSRYPTIDFNAYAQNFWSREAPVVSFIEDPYRTLNSSPSLSLDLNYTLFDGHKARIDKSRYEELLRQTEGNVAVAVENAIEAVIGSYYQALLDKEQLNVFQEVLNLSRDQVSLQRIRKEYGQASDFDIIQSQDAYLNDSTNFVLQLNQYENSMRNLLLAMGERNIDQKYELTDQLTYKAEAYNFNDLKRRMQGNNKQLLNLETARNIQRIEKEYQRSFKRPTLQVGGGLTQRLNLSNSTAVNPNTKEEFGFASGSSTNLYMNLSFNYRLFDAGIRSRNIENAQIRENMAELKIEELQRQLSTQLKNTLETYNNRRNIVKITEELIVNARKNLKIAEDRFRAGQINDFDYRTIQLRFVNASQARLSAIYNVLITETELVKMIGGLIRE